jgi:chitin disaccharide deacetylase
MKETRLIVNADDFGMSRGISDGIIRAHLNGFLTSTSLMVNMPGSEKALEHLSTATRLSVGIHLNICQGLPVSPARDIPTLVDDGGTFHPPAMMIRKLWRWQVSARDLEREFHAQICWLKSRGFNPTHADSHHHVHIYPAAARAFARALSAAGIRCVRASRCSSWPKNRGIGGLHEGGIVRQLFVHGYRSTLQNTLLRKFHSPNSRVSFSQQARRDVTNLKSHWMTTFENLPEGTFEFACHPGLWERGFSETDRIYLQREQELELLLDPEMQGVIARRGIQLISYRELFAAPQLSGECDHGMREVA